MRNLKLPLLKKLCSLNIFYSRSYDDRAKKALDKKPARRSQKDPDPASSSYYYDEVDQHMMEKEKVRREIFKKTLNKVYYNTPTF